MRIKIISFIIVFIPFSFVFAQKADTLVHINGNVMTGELKKLQYGILLWKMDGMGTIDVEIPKISTLKSKKRFDIRLQNGNRYYGSFDASAQKQMVNLVLTTGNMLVGIADIAQIFPLKRSFWLRTSGDFGFGGNYSKGSDLLTLNFSAALKHRRESAYYDFSLDTYYTFQDDSLSSIKSDARLGWEHLRKSKLSYGANLGFGQNYELGTKMRIDLTIVGIYDIIFNSWTRFSALAGISMEQEYPYSDDAPAEYITGNFALGWKVYKLTKPKVWLESNIQYLPYYNSDKRYRLNLNFNPKVGLIGNNLKIGFRTYYSFDSQPVTEEANKEDWGANLEINYSFH